MKQSRNAEYIITTKKVLTEVEEQNLKTMCRRLTMKGYDADGRNGLMLLLTLECGLRITETLNLRVRDFDAVSESVFIQSLKGSNKRELPLHQSTARYMKKLILSDYSADSLADVPPDDKIFKISYDRAYQIWQEYTPNPEKTLHSLRHTFAVRLYVKSKDIRAVQMALGHRRIDNSLVYVDFVYSQGTLRRLMSL